MAIGLLHCTGGDCALSATFHPIITWAHGFDYSAQQQGISPSDPSGLLPVRDFTALLTGDRGTECRIVCNMASGARVELAASFRAAGSAPHLSGRRSYKSRHGLSAGAFTHRSKPTMLRPALGVRVPSDRSRAAAPKKRVAGRGSVSSPGGLTLAAMSTNSLLSLEAVQRHFRQTHGGVVEGDLGGVSKPIDEEAMLQGGTLASPGGRSSGIASPRKLAQTKSYQLRVASNIVQRLKDVSVRIAHSCAVVARADPDLHTGVQGARNRSAANRGRHRCDASFVLDRCSGISWHRVDGIRRRTHVELREPVLVRRDRASGLLCWQIADNTFRAGMSCHTSASQGGVLGTWLFWQAPSRCCVSFVSCTCSRLALFSDAGAY